jgi:hypothetical protein
VYALSLLSRLGLLLVLVGLACCLPAAESEPPGLRECALAQAGAVAACAGAPGPMTEQACASALLTASQVCWPQ